MDQVTDQVQPGILAPIPPLARYLTFALEPGSDPAAALRELREIADGDGTVVGLGQPLVLAVGGKLDALHPFPARVGAGFEVPSTPAALWCWLRGEDRGELVHRTRRLQRALASSFRPTQVIDAFRYRDGDDLTGYEDGTENPEGEAAIEAAIVTGQGNGLDGSSFVAVQQWVHDLERFDAMPAEEQDHTFGRRKSDNREIEDAPPSAHVKRTAQEGFDPQAFVLRRSMPWADDSWEGLVFVSFGKSLDAYEALLNRMVGADDGVVDNLFRFTRPVTGSYFWCPPLREGRLDLSALG